MYAQSKRAQQSVVAEPLRSRSGEWRTCRAAALPLLASGIGWKPAFGHSLALLEEFKDGPQAREAYHSKNDGRDVGPKHQRACHAAQADAQEQPPATRAPIVFGFDDQGVEHPDAGKRGCSDD